MKPLHVAHTQLEVYGLYYTWFIAHLFCPFGFVCLNIGAILSVVPPVRVRPLVLDRLVIFDFCGRVCQRQGSRDFAIFRSVSFLLVYH